MLRALDHSYCFSPCVQEELGTEGRSWAPETKVEPESQQNEHLGGAQTLGRGKGPAHIECLLCALGESPPNSPFKTIPKDKPYCAKVVLSPLPCENTGIDWRMRLEDPSSLEPGDCSEIEMTASAGLQRR